MTREQLTEKIKEIARENTGAELAEGVCLKECGLDSLSLVAAIAGIEESFGFFFRDDDLQPDNLTTLEALVQLTENYL